MPIISAFYGIIIRMFYKEHEPRHFHAEHNDQQAKIAFSGAVIAGEIRSRKAVSEFGSGQQFTVPNSRPTG